MRKYIYILKTTFLDSIQYVSSILFKFIGYFISIFVMFSLWSYVYSDASNIINGYTLTQMMWYILMSEIITYGGNSKIIINEITEDIKNGNIAYHINKPYHYLGYIFMKYIGDSILRVLLYALVSILLAVLFVGFIPGFNFTNIIFIILSFILGFLINGFIKITISLLSFWIEDSEPFHWIYNKFMLILGVFFPVEMFPKFLQPYIAFTPVYVVIYGPSKLVVGFSFELFKSILIGQLIYTLITGLIMILVFKKGVKRVNVNGG